MVTMSEDIEDVSFLPGDTLNRKSVYEPSVRQRCKHLVCSKGKATTIIVIAGLFILVIAVVASLARSASDSSCPNNDQLNRITTTVQTETTTIDYIATNGKNFPWHDVRLPDAVLPESYDLFLHTDFVRKVFTGKVTIKCRVVRSTDQIILHVKKLNLTKNVEVIDDKRKGHIQVVDQLEFIKNEQLLIQLSKQIPKGSTIYIKMEYKAELKKQLSGFYLSTYQNKQNETKYLATTQFEATEARSAFPCFDEPAMKAKFTLTMLREKGYITLFNMPEKKGESKTWAADASLEVDTFETSVKMSTYLVAFVVCEFDKVVQKTKSGTEVSVYAPKEQISQADYPLHVAVTVLDYYDDLFQTPYPLPKQDLVAVPDFSAGAMENWGLILYRMTDLLYDPVRSSSHDKEWVAIVVAHELAHQWFGNLVTLKWWDDLWLNEGFASYVEFLGTNVTDATWKMDEQFITEHLQTAMYQDCLKSSHPIQVPVHSPSQINDIFDSISYHKGASIIRMLKNYMKPEVFDKGIANYLQKYKYGNAVTDDLWQSLSQVNKGAFDVKAVMDTWTRQMGFPVITLTLNKNKMTLSQQRFLIYPKSSIKELHTSPFGYMWHIPFIYGEMKSDGTFTKKFLHFKVKTVTQDISSDSVLVKGNFGMYGYYRVNYDKATWQKIVQQLQTNHTVFSESDRAGLLDDVFELARAGLVDHTIALDMTKYLSKEDGYLPWQSALNGLDYIKNRLEDISEVGLLKKYLLKLMQGRIADLGWETKDKLQLTKMLQSLLLSQALHLSDDEVIKKGKQLYREWMSNTSNIDADLRSVIHAAGIIYGGEKEWEFLWKQYTTSNVPTEKNAMLRVLTTTKHNELLQKLLQYGLNNKELKSQDLPTVITHIASNTDGKLLAWRFVQRNWKLMMKWYGNTAFSLSGIIKGCTASFSTEFDFTEVENFFKEHDAGPGTRSVYTSLENIQMNIQWLKLYKDDIKIWLKTNA